MSNHGLLLAAGAGTRMGRPKALVDGWLTRAVDSLEAAGCEGVTVVLGAGADEAHELLAEAGVEVREVVAEDWADGMGASLRAGLESLDDGPVAVIVTLVDLPDVGAEVVRRVLADPVDRATLRRAAYDGTPGHPVLIGRDHWASLRETLSGDSGAQGYLSRRIVHLVSCEDLATGRDVDRPEDLA